MIPVSVVIPAYDSAEFLAGTLETVHAQTERAAEIIVVDDGSADATAAVAERCGALVVRQANRGVSAARNAGVAAASQPWIAFLDSDDRWEPLKLALQWAALAAAPEAGLCFTDYYVFGGERRLAESSFARRSVLRGLARTPVSADAALCERASLASAYLRENFIHPSTLLVRRSLLEECAGFDARMRYSEDWELVLRLIAKTNAVMVEKSLAGYHYRAGSAARAAVKILLGNLGIAERIIAAPERYPAGAAAFAERSLPARLAEVGAAHFRLGEFPGAREYFSRSLRTKWRPDALFGACLASVLDNPLGIASHRLVRTAWRRSRRLSPDYRG
jgi:glycosyltransferase involved in cell wall biosynthesis